MKAWSTLMKMLIFGSGLIMLIAIGSYFILKANLQQLAKSFVSSQTDGRYALTVERLNFSGWKAQIELINAAIQPTDPMMQEAHAGFRFPVIFIKTHSWISLLQGQIELDSVYLKKPLFESFDAKENKTVTRPAIETAQLIDGLENMMSVLNIRILKLDSGTIKLQTNDDRAPFICSNVSVMMGGFSHHIGSPINILDAEELIVSMPEQKWMFQNGEQQIEFKRFRFSGSNKYFEIDSCTLRNYSSDGTDTIQITMEQLAFKSEKLSALYESNWLALDTLWCVRPVLNLYVKRDVTQADSTTLLSELQKSIQYNFSVGHLDVLEGQLSIQTVNGDKQSGYTTEKVSLTMEQLELNPNETPFFKTGIIKLEAFDLAFYTPDSLYVLTLEKFDINGNNVRFINAFFKPTPANSNQAMSVFIGDFLIVGLSLDDLLEKRIVARKAVFNSPAIKINNPAIDTTAKESVTDLTVFYDALHGLSQLLLVNDFSITNGSLSYLSEAPAPMQIQINGLNMNLQLREFLKVRALVDIKQSISFLSTEGIEFSSDKLEAQLSQLILFGDLEQSSVSFFELRELNGINISARQLFWQHLDWDSLITKKLIIADSVHFGNVTLNTVPESQLKANSEMTLPGIAIRQVNIDEIKIVHRPGEEMMVTSGGNQLKVVGLHNIQNNLQWDELTVNLTDTRFVNQMLTVNTEKIRFSSKHTSEISGITFNLHHTQGNMEVKVPVGYFLMPITSTDIAVLNVPVLSITEPEISIIHAASDSVHSGKSTPAILPPDLRIGKLNIMKAKVKYTVPGNAGAKEIALTTNINANDVITGNNQPALLQIANLELSVFDQSINYPQLQADIPAMKLLINQFQWNNVRVGEKPATQLNAEVSGTWSGVSMHIDLQKKSMMQLNNFSGNFPPALFSFHSNDKPDWIEWGTKMNITACRLHFADSINTVSVDDLNWQSGSHTLQATGFRFLPRLRPQEYFRQSTWQSDYIKGEVQRITITGLQPEQLWHDSMFTAKEILLTSPQIMVWRDKRLPFRHGIEKPMPTSLLISMKEQNGIEVDSVIVTNGTISYHEVSRVTNQEGSVSFTDINAAFTNLKNRTIKTTDSLTIQGTMTLYGSTIRKIKYQESYFDSLSSFNMSFTGSPLQLTEISKTSKPLAAFEINSGNCNTLSAVVSGNKHAAYGEIRFFYNDLHVSLLDHQDSLRSRLSLAFTNFVTNEFVLKTNNNKRSSMFFVRDNERFVFQYWLRTIMSGVLTSAGVKRNKQYNKEYQQLRDQYSLPEGDFGD